MIISQNKSHNLKFEHLYSLLLLLPGEENVFQLQAVELPGAILKFHPLNVSVQHSTTFLHIYLATGQSMPSGDVLRHLFIHAMKTSCVLNT